MCRKSFKLGAEPLGNGLTGQAMAVLIPVTYPQGLAEAMEKNMVLGSVFLERGSQQQYRYVVALTKTVQAALGIEEVIHPQ